VQKQDNLTTLSQSLSSYKFLSQVNEVIASSEFKTFVFIAGQRN
jgi:hypothetical protein